VANCGSSGAGDSGAGSGDESGGSPEDDSSNSSNDQVIFTGTGAGFIIIGENGLLVPTSEPSSYAPVEAAHASSGRGFPRIWFFGPNARAKPGGGDAFIWIDTRPSWIRLLTAGPSAAFAGASTRVSSSLQRGAALSLQTNPDSADTNFHVKEMPKVPDPRRAAEYSAQNRAKRNQSFKEKLRKLAANAYQSLIAARFKRALLLIMGKV
jgi:hypothetical protein